MEGRDGAFHVPFLNSQRLHENLILPRLPAWDLRHVSYLPTNIWHWAGLGAMYNHGGSNLPHLKGCMLAQKGSSASISCPHFTPVTCWGRSLPLGKETRTGTGQATFCTHFLACWSDMHALASLQTVIL